MQKLSHFPSPSFTIQVGQTHTHTIFITKPRSERPCYVLIYCIFYYTKHWRFDLKGRDREHLEFKLKWHWISPSSTNPLMGAGDDGGLRCLIGNHRYFDDKPHTNSITTFNANQIKIHTFTTKTNFLPWIFLKTEQNFL